MNYVEQYAKLNPEQKQAVDHIDGPFIVLAGAGTGKTQIIALRIAHILEATQMEPQNILCLTFTETGATAMRKRLIEMIGTAAYYVQIGTFHSFCNDVIKDHPEKFLSANDLEPLTDVEHVRLMKEVLDTLPADSALKPFGAPYFYIRPLGSAIQSLKREGVSVKRYAEIVNQLEKFLADTAEQFDAFIGIHGRSLTATQCEDFLQQFSQNKAHTTTDASPSEQPSTIIQDLASVWKQHEDHPAGFKQAVKKYYERLKNQLPKQQTVIEIYESYQSALKKRGRYDYEDMLLFVAEAFEADADLLAEYQEQYQYILVDEYQDTNGAQNKVVELLGSFFTDPNIFAVGDDRQSIYRFQGASLENILYFSKRYGENAQVISLKQNYRSHQKILDAAQSLVQHNQHAITEYLPHIEQNLTAAMDITSQQIQVGEFETSATEYYWIAKHIQQLIATGTDPSEIAVLYRNNRDADDLMDILEFLEIPFHLEAGLNILEDKNIVKLVDFLRYLAAASGGSDETLFYILHYDFLQINGFDIIRAVTYKQRLMKEKSAENINLTLFSVIESEEHLRTAGVENPQPFIALSEHILKWRKTSVNMSFARWFEEFINESGYLEYIIDQPEKIEHLNRTNTFFDEMKQINKTDPNMSLKDVIEYLDLLREHSLTLEEKKLQTQKQAVRLMTAHRAKGLEFEHVYIMRCIDKHWGNVPNRNKLDLPPGIIQNDLANDVKEKNEDDRRLFYVAMTRAKRQLTITYPKQSEGGRALVPSIYLAEIDEQFLDRIDTGAIEDEAFERLQLILTATPRKEYTNIEREYLTDLLVDYTMSASHLNDYLKCPRLFFYQDILRVPKPTTRDIGFGIAIHDTLKDVSNYFAQQRELPDFKYVLKVYIAQLDRQLLNKKDYTDSKDFGEKTLRAYYKEHKERLADNAFPEKDFSAHGVEVDGVPLTGKIDAIEIIDEHGDPVLNVAENTSRTIHVIDYKTGNPDNKSDKLAKTGDYFRQLVFYKILCDTSPQFKYTVTSGEINFVQQSKRKKGFAHRRYELTDQDVTELKETITNVYTKIKSLHFLNPDPDELCGECRFCEQFQ